MQRCFTSAFLLLLSISCLPSQTRTPELEALSWAFAANHDQLIACAPAGAIRWQTALNPPGFSAFVDLTLTPDGRVWLAEQSPPRLHRFHAVTGALESVVDLPLPLGSRVSSISLNRFAELALLLKIPDPMAFGGLREEVGLFDLATEQVLWRMTVEPELRRGVPFTTFEATKVRCDRNGGIWLLDRFGTVMDPSVRPWSGGWLMMLDRTGTIRVSAPHGGSDITITADDEVWSIFQPTGGGPADIYRYGLDGTLQGVRTIPFAGLPAGNYQSRLAAHAAGEVFLAGAYAHPTPAGFSVTLPEPLPGTTGLGLLEFGSGVAHRAPSSPDSGPASDGVLAFGADGAPWLRFSDSGIGSTGSSLRLARLTWSSNPAGASYPGYTFDFELPIPSSIPGIWPFFPRPSNGWTIYQYCLAADPAGDIDGDGVLNRNELMDGTDPTDPASARSRISLSQPLIPGGTGQIELLAPGGIGLEFVSFLDGTTSSLGLQGGRVLSPDPFSLLASLWMNPATGFSTNAIGTLGSDPMKPNTGRAMIDFPVPLDPSLRGVQVYFGHVVLDPNARNGIRTAAGPMAITL